MDHDERREIELVEKEVSLDDGRVLWIEVDRRDVKPGRVVEVLVLDRPNIEQPQLGLPCSTWVVCLTQLLHDPLASIELLVFGSRFTCQAGRGKSQRVCVCQCLTQNSRKPTKQNRTERAWLPGRPSALPSE